MATTREYVYNAEGNKILTKETISEGKYDTIDLILRIVGSSAVIVTIIGLSCNINAQRKQQKVLFQLGIYEKSLPVINKLCFNLKNDSNYIAARNIFSYEIVPKIRLTNNDNVIKNVDNLDTLLVLGEHCSGLLDSFRYMSRAFYVLANNYITNKIGKDSLFYNDFEEYRTFFTNSKYRWETHKDLYSKALRIAFLDTAEQKGKDVQAFYDELFKIINAYSDLWLYNKFKQLPLDSLSQQVSLPQFVEILKSKKLLTPANLVISFKPFYNDLEKIDTAILQRMNEMQRAILSAMTESNR